MIKFIKDSLRDFKHVVWPTKEETRKYFGIVLIVLLLFWIYLFIASTIFSESLLKIRSVLNSESNNEWPKINIEDILGTWATTNSWEITIEDLELNVETETSTVSENQN